MSREGKRFYYLINGDEGDDDEREERPRKMCGGDDVDTHTHTHTQIYTHCFCLFSKWDPDQYSNSRSLQKAAKSSQVKIVVVWENSNRRAGASDPVQNNKKK